MTMQSDGEGSFVILNRAEAEALLDPAKVRPEMLRCRFREQAGLGPYKSLLDRLEHYASEAEYESGVTCCIVVEDDEDNEELGIYSDGEFRWDSERFRILNTQ